MSDSVSDLDYHDGYDSTIMSFEWPLDTTVLHEGSESVVENRVPGLLQAAGEHQATGKSASECFSWKKHLIRVLYLGRAGAA